MALRAVVRSGAGLWLACVSATVASAQADRSLADQLAQTRRHDTLRIAPGVHRITAPLVIRQPLTLLAESGAVIEGAGNHTLIVIAADSVSVIGLGLRGVGLSNTEERAAIRVDSAAFCHIARNVVTDAFFGIYLSKGTDCLVEHNQISGSGATEQRNGNGIHLWSSQRVHVVGNTVERYRDGIYMEFVTKSEIRDNTSTANRRYGLHFMFSNDCRYEGNTFANNGAGVAVMYTKNVGMIGNHFMRNRGTAAYGLLLKDITDSEIRENTFDSNTTALHMDGAARVRVVGNEFANNGWGVRLLANAVGTTIEENQFLRNTFDVTTNSRSTSAQMRHNYWDAYRGYDLDGDGYGDNGHRPVTLYSLVVEQHRTSLALQGSLLITLIDVAERAFPVLTPSTLIDESPRMRRTP